MMFGVVNMKTLVVWVSYVMVINHGLLFASVVLLGWVGISYSRGFVQYNIIIKDSD